MSAAKASPPRTALRCAALALLCAALAHAARDRRAEMSPVPFVMGSRYGRSPERVMTPRNDRFFMGSRYGKRSEGGGGGAGAEVAGGEGARRLLCEYTGVLALFRCAHERDHPRLLRHTTQMRGAEDGGPGEQ